MNSIAHIYRAELIRAVFGSHANEGKVADLERLNQIAEHLATCEEAQSIIRAKGHGAAGMSFVELARSVPDHPLGKIKQLFTQERPLRYPDMGECNDAWSAR